MNKYLVSGLIFLMIIVVGCFMIIQDKEITISGNYKSVRGVMDQLSCYCFNSGYLMTSEDKIPICFENDEEVECKKIEVNGFYKTKKIHSEITNSCQSGKIQLFYVSSYKCR